MRVLNILFSIFFLASASSAQEATPESDTQAKQEEAAVIAAEEPGVSVSATTTTNPRPADSGVTLDLDATSVTGNRELPKVLYIVPWRKAELGDLVGRPIGSLLDEVIEPIDPEVFQRQLDYYKDATSEEAGTSSVNSDVLKSNKFADNSE